MAWNSALFHNFDSGGAGNSGDRTAAGAEAGEKITCSQLNGLSLAFIGDAVYELMVRQYVLSGGDAKIGTLHSGCVRLVNADFQAEAADKISDLLSDSEAAVFRRGRNAHPSHTPKNKTEGQYHKATGLEALIGYLYLKRDFGRLDFLFSYILESVKADG